MNFSQSPRLRPSGSRAGGFTLLEVLVSIVILSFGMLGMVGLQAASLQANRDARQQSVAIGLAKELAEMMRGNKDVALDVAANNFYLGDFAGTPLLPAAPTYCLSAGTACAKADVAKAELTEWLTRVESDLPGARVVICNDSAPFDANGLPRWACAAAGATDVIVVKIGWSRSTFRKATTAADVAIDKALAPSVVLPVTAGSNTL